MAAADIKSVGVVGLGTMGAGIAEVCARAGFHTVAYDVSDEAVERGRAAFSRSLAKGVERGKVDVHAGERAHELLVTTTDLTALADADFVIEAAIEDIEVKRELFATLDEVASAAAALSTNTSALSVTEIAAATKRPARVVGMHFFNPAPVLPLVEVVRTDLTGEDSFDSAYAFTAAIGKQPIACRDTPGFVVNRILVPVLNDAVRVFDEGTASAADVDRAMELGASWPIGPLALIDLIGIDVHVHVSEVLWQAYREARYAPPPGLVRMMKAGHLGRKSGRGFFEYERS